MICRPVIPIFVNLLTFLFQVNAREKIVGWYHTGPKLHPNDIAINELIKKYNSNPVLVIVDAKPKDVGLPTDAYIGIEEVHDVSKLNLSVLQPTTIFVTPDCEIIPFRAAHGKHLCVIQLAKF